MKESKKDKLEKYARKEFGVELDKRLSIKKLESQIKELESNKDAVEESTFDVYESPKGRILEVDKEDSKFAKLLIDSKWKKV